MKIELNIPESTLWQDNVGEVNVERVNELAELACQKLPEAENNNILRISLSDKIKWRKIDTANHSIIIPADCWRKFNSNEKYAALTRYMCEYLMHDEISATEKRTSRFKANKMWSLEIFATFLGVSSLEDSPKTTMACAIVVIAAVLIQIDSIHHHKNLKKLYADCNKNAFEITGDTNACITSLEKEGDSDRANILRKSLLSEAETTNFAGWVKKNGPTANHL